MEKDEFMDIDNHLKIDRKDTKVWLVKIPNFLYQQWTDISKPNVELGRLKIYKDSVKSSSGKLEPKVELVIPNEPWSEQLPKNYNLKFTNTTPQNEYIFTQDQDIAIEIAGKVQHEATIGPVIDDEYRKIMQERTQEATSKSRYAQTLNQKESKSQGFKSYRDMTPGGFGIMRKKDTTAEKRERLPRSDVLDMLFAEFEKTPYWTFKALADATNQPQAWLKECLVEVAVLNKRGPYAGKYQLLPEYRNKNQEVVNN